MNTSEETPKEKTPNKKPLSLTMKEWVKNQKTFLVQSELMKKSPSNPHGLSFRDGPEREGGRKAGDV